MRCFVRTVNPILAGVATASVLGAILWQQVGAVCSAVYWDPTSRLVNLFAGHLMPGMIGVSVAAGLVTGSLDGVGRLKNAYVRGAAAAVLFAVIAFPIYAVFGPQASHVVGTISASPMEPTAVVSYALLAIVALAFTSIIGAAPYVAFAAAAASLGECARRRSPRLVAAAIALACCTSLGIVFVQGAELRAALRVLARTTLKAEPIITRNLIRLPANCRWRPSPGTRFPEHVRSISCRMDFGTISFEPAQDGGVRSARASLAMPKISKAETKEALSLFLRGSGVNEKVVRNLRRDVNGTWEAVSGSYSVVLRNWRQRDD